MKCTVCGKELPPGIKKYCSRECFKKARSSHTDESATDTGSDQDWKKDISLPPSRYVDGQGHALDLPQNLKLSNLSFTGAGLIFAYSLIIFLLTSAIHQGVFLESEDVITYVHYGYSVLLVLFGWGLRKDLPNIVTGLLVGAALMLVGDIFFALNKRVSPTVLPVLINSFIIYSAWLIKKRAFEL